MKPAKRRRNARICREPRRDSWNPAIPAVSSCCSRASDARSRPASPPTTIANDPDLKPSHIGVALHRYTQVILYMAKLIEGTPRVGLDGEVDGAVSASEANDAIAELKGRGRLARVVGGGQAPAPAN